MSGEGDGGGEDERAADPGKGAEVLAEQFDTQKGAHCGLNVEEDAGTGGWDVVNAPVPEESCGCGAEQAADGQGDPGGGADVGKRRRWYVLVGERRQEPGTKDPEGEHGGSGEDGVGGDHGRAVGLHQLFAEEDPGEGDEQGDDDHEVAEQGGDFMAGRGAAAAEGDESGADGGSAKGDPAQGVELFAGKEGGGDGQHDGHGAHHEGGVAYGGSDEAVKLEKKLDGHAEEGGDEKDAHLSDGEPQALESLTAGVEEHDGQHAQGGKGKAVEDHRLHAHFVEREAAEVEAGSPETSGEGTGAISQKPKLCADDCFLRHPFITVAHGRDLGTTAQNAADRREYISMMKCWAMKCWAMKWPAVERATKRKKWMCVSGWLVAGGLLLAAGGAAWAQSSPGFAPERFRAVKERVLPSGYPDKPSMAPSWTIPTEPLGFSPPGSLYLGQRNSLVSLDFIGEDRLLFSFRVPGLIHRELKPGETADSEERQIRAVVLTLPEGNVEAEGLWTVHDRTRYLWMLKDGHFLLRDKNNVQQGDAHLLLKPQLQFPGPLLWLELDPTQQYLVSNSYEPVSTPVKPGQVGSPATAAATITQASQSSSSNPESSSGSDSSSDASPGTPDRVVRILRLGSGKVMLVSRVRSTVHLPINAEGYLESLRGRGEEWILNLHFFTGGSKILGSVNSTCSPTLEFIAQQEVLATACTGSGSHKLIAVTTDGKILWDNLNPETSIWPLLDYSANGLRVTQETLAVTHPVSAYAPLSSDEIKGQLLRVLDAATGDMVFESPVSPMFDAGGNTAVSPTGRRVAVLNGGAIQVFELPAPPALPDADGKRAAH